MAVEIIVRVTRKGEGVLVDERSSEGDRDGYVAGIEEGPATGCKGGFSSTVQKEGMH